MVLLRTKLHGVFYGWWIVASGVVISMLQAGFYFYGFGVFYLPLLESLGSSRAALGGVIGLSRLEGGLLSPVTGWLIDRYGPRRPLFAGLFIMGLCFLILSRITALWMLYVVFLVMAAAGSVGGTRPFTIAVANWFVRKRSRAMGFLLAGFGLGGSMGWALSWLVETLGWRTSAVIGGLLFWVVGFPLAWLVRHRPEQMGLSPDGTPPTLSGEPASLSGATGKPPDFVDVELTPRQAIRSLSFWMLAIAFGAWSTVITVTAVYHIPFLIEEVGASPVTAATVASVMLFITVPGRIIFGWIGDLVDLRLLMAGLYLIQGLGVALLALLPSLEWAPLYVLVLAPAYGGTASLRQAIVAHLYGRKNFGTISGLLQVVDLPGTILGPIFVGWVFDSVGSYRPAFLSLAVLLAIGAVAVLLARRPQLGEGSLGATEEGSS